MNQVKTSKQFAPLVANLVDSYDVIAQITFEVNKKNVEKSIKHLGRALEIINSRKLINGLKYVAVS